MFNINNQLKELRSSIIGLVLLLGAAIIGLIWISIGIYGLMTAWLGPVWGPLLLGVIFLLPVVVIVLVNFFSKPAPPQPLSYSEDSMANIAKLTESLSGQSPFVATSVAVIAGVIAARFPALLTVFIQLASAWAADMKLRAARAAEQSAKEPPQ